MNLIIATSLLIVAILPATSTTSYYGYKVIRIVPEDRQTVDFISKMYKNSGDYNLDFWKMSKSISQASDIMVPPENLDEFTRFLDNNQVKYSVMINDVGARIDEEEKERAASAFSSTYNYAAFNSYDDMVSELYSLENSNPSVAKVLNVGISTENRNIYAMKISKGPGKKAIWIDCGIHAREWISPATCMYTINYLLKSINMPGIASALLDKYDWIILPSLNPDGYTLTFTNRQYRLWRKNTSSNGGACRGVDLNRNWDHMWTSGIGTSTNPCDETYKGTKPFSEKETSSVSRFLRTLKGSLKAFFTIHSYSQMWLTPDSYTTQPTPDYAELIRVAYIGVNAISRRYGTKYTYGPPGSLLYPVSAGSTDWARYNLDVPYSYALELRDRGLYGFQLPASQIIPTAEETIDGILASVQSLP